MDRVFLGTGGSRAVKQFRHVLVPPAYAQKHAMRMHMRHHSSMIGQRLRRREMHTLLMSEQQMRHFHTLIGGLEPFMEELRGIDLLDSVRAAPPDPTGDAVAVRGDNLPWECGEHPGLGQRHNDMSQTLHTHRVRQRSADSPLHVPVLEGALLISRQRHKSTPDMVYDVFNYVTDKAHAEVFGEPPLWGSGLPKDECFGEYGHLGTRSCQSVLPSRDVIFAQSEEVQIVDAFPVQPSTRPLPPGSKYAKASRLPRCSSPVPQPTSAATGVAPQLRGMGGEKTSAMAEGEWSWMRDWDLAQGETARPSPTAGAMGMDIAWAHHHR